MNLRLLSLFKNPLMRVNAFWAILSGIACAFAFPNIVYYRLNWQGSLLAWVAILPLFLIKETTVRRYVGWGFLSGCISFGLSIYWLGLMPALGPLAPGVWLILTLYLALYPAVFLGLTEWFVQHDLPRWSMTPALWVLLEFVRNYFVSGFPWVGLGYAHYQTPWLMHLVPFSGVWGLTFLTLLVNVLLFEFIQWLKPIHPKQIIPTLILVFHVSGMVLITSAILAGGWLESQRLRTIPDLSQTRVAALQGNVDQNRAWDNLYRRSTLDRFYSLAARSVAQKAELIIWPESSFPGIFNWDHELANEVKKWSRQWQISQAVASDTVDLSDVGNYRYYNSILWLNSNGMVTGKSSKIHLVPFGEYIPFKKTLLFFIQKLVPRYENGEFTPGQQRIPLLWRLRGRIIPVGGLICFESIFPQYASDLVGKGCQLLLVVTYDTWFGTTAAPAQHALFSAFRAAETDRYVVRTAATGISCVFDPTGHLLGMLPLNQADTLVHTVGLRDTTSFYVQWGPWFAWLCLIWIGIWLVWCFIRQPLKSVSKNI